MKKGMIVYDRVAAIRCVTRPNDQPRIRRLGWFRYEVFRPYFEPHPDDDQYGLFGWVTVVWGRRRAERRAMS